MSHKISYKCSRCHTHTSRELLTVKKVSFVEMGAGGRTLKCRVTAWLCPKCTAEDAVWQQEPFKAPREKAS